MKFRTLSRAEGFTLPEVIMVVAVMAIVSAMAFPDIVSFFKRQSFEQEKIIQADIVKALDAYSKNRTAQVATGSDTTGDGSTIVTVPLGDAPGAYADPKICTETGWGKQLAGFSNLSAEEICNDVWGEPRIYTVARDMLSYRDGQFDTYYVSIFSPGENKTDDTNMSKNPWTDAAGYGAYQALGDDHVAKFSDVKLKTELFEETLRRMDRVVEALDRYAQARYNEALLINEPYNSLKLFYPAEDQDYSNINAEDDRPVGIQQPGSWYGEKVKTDVQNAAGQNSLATGSGVDSGVRKGEMEALMRVIGLPQEFCCNALTGEPFYYYSNPIIKMNSGMGCKRRVEPPYMPPKLTIEALEPGCN